MRDNIRSVMGNQFQITLPSDWRNTQNVGKGDKVHAHYEPNSVLIITAARPLTALENHLIDLLIRLPNLRKTKEITEELRTATAMIDTQLLTPCYAVS
jgi:phosphate uptake regulator